MSHSIQIMLLPNLIWVGFITAHKHVYCHKKYVSNISEFMFKADIIFTSAGRTMYEICSIGVPTICLCQNLREKKHIFGNTNNGFINMGLGSDVSRQEIIDKFNTLSADFEIREEFNRRMLSIDLKHGFENIVSILKEEYRNFELKNDLK